MAKGKRPSIPQNRKPQNMAQRHQALLQQAIARHQAGDYAAAEQGYRAVLKENPREPDALQLQALIEKHKGHFETCVAMLQTALAIQPDAPALLNNLGNALREMGRLPEAIEVLTRAVAVSPDYYEAWNNLGNVYKDASDFRQAGPCYQKALALKPDYADALNNLGGVFQKQGDLTLAARHYSEAIRLRPDFAVAYYNLGNVLTDAGQLDQGLANYRTSVKHDPNYLEAVNGLLRQLQNMCEWDELPALYERFRVLATTTGRVFPFAFLAVPATAAEQQQCARLWAEKQYGAFMRHAREHPFTYRARTPGEPIRLGYLSSDFHDHATAFLMAEVFELHDKNRFEVHAFSLGPDDGKAMRQRLIKAFHQFHDLRGRSWEECARFIHAQGIDILVDLKGYTKDTGSAVMAFRPAPVQAQYLGYPGTLGAKFIDYLIGDKWVTPPEAAPFYDEAFAYLPNSYQCNDRHRRIGERPTRAACGLPQEAFVYCCFNHTYKITPEIFDIWCELLRQTEGSVLWLLRSNTWAEANLQREAEKRGVAGGRIVFADNLPLEQHLGRLQNADLFLDTLPVNAHTTASDALWAGVPVVTCMGETFIARVAGSLLHAVGLPDLVTQSLDDYRALALKLAHSPQILAVLRQHLIEKRMQLPLFDTPRLTAGLEALYGLMWQRHEAARATQAQGASV